MNVDSVRTVNATVTALCHHSVQHLPSHLPNPLLKHELHNHLLNQAVGPLLGHLLPPHLAIVVGESTLAPVLVVSALTAYHPCKANPRLLQVLPQGRLLGLQPYYETACSKKYLVDVIQLTTKSRIHVWHSIRSWIRFGDKSNDIHPWKLVFHHFQGKWI